MYRSLSGLRSSLVPLPASRALALSTGTARCESGPRLLAPTARNLLSHYGLTGSEMPATGPRNVLLKEDVVNHVVRNNLTPRSLTSQPPELVSQTVRKASDVSPSHGVRRKTKGARFTDIELTNMRRVIARRLTESKQSIPHAYLSTTCDVSSVLQHRVTLLSESGVKVSLNDYVVKSVALSLKKMPQMNVTWREGNFTLESSSQSTASPVDISIAVSTASGLITPIIKDANRLSIPEIAACIADLASRARAGSLQPHEFVGGCFTISNLGMFGVTSFSAIINPPQTAILAVGRAVPVPRPGGLVAADMSFTLSYDARAISEETAALFMESLGTLIQDPLLMMRAGDGSDNRRLASLIS